MKLAGEHIERICAALLEAFPSREKLKQIVRFGLNVKLDEIVGNGNLTDTVFALVEWGESNDKVHELIAAACKQAPNNAALQALAVENFSSYSGVSTPAQGVSQIEVDSPDLEGERAAIYAHLVQLLPVQFGEVCFKLGLPRQYQNRNDAQTQQSIELIDYAQQQPNGLQRLKNLLRQVK